jgi:y4mF family transcriptional regulator
MEAKTPEQLGAAIRARRKAMKITQKELAMTCGTGLRFIVDLEKGKPTCHLGKTLLVLRSLGLSVSLGPPATGGGKP